MLSQLLLAFVGFRTRNLAPGIAVCAAAVLLHPGAATALQPAPDLVVNSAADTSDGDCDFLGEGSGNQDCTLREAIATAGAGSITFDIPEGSPGCSGANVCTIQLGSQLSLNSQTLRIDGAANGAKITLDGGDGMAGGVRIFDVVSGALHLNGLTLVDANGGALFTAFCELTVSNCTFANNYLNGGGAAIKSENRPVNIYNSTFYGNTGTNCGAVLHGGASFAPITIWNSTFADNVATFGGGFAHAILTGRPLTLYNTLLAAAPGTFNVNCAVQSGGSITADDHNVANDFSCDSAIATNIYLEPLADNGGPTPTMLLSESDFAINAGDDAVCNAAPVNGLDQRGFLRPAGFRCDVGATELGAVAPPPPDACPETPGECTTPGKSIALIKLKNGKTKLLWKWIKGDIPSLDDLGDPTQSNDYRLCLYSNGTLVGGTDDLGYAVAAGGDCGGKDC